MRDLARSLRDAQAEVKQAAARITELEDEARSHATSARRADKAVQAAQHQVSRAQEELVALREHSTEGTRDQYVDHALEIVRTMAISLGRHQLTGSSSSSSRW
jgi:capsule polysaccharide export protein KpsE/RkpR